ncbi:MAG: redoxin family protein [Gammaproteobacteria bacterium]
MRCPIACLLVLAMIPAAHAGTDRLPDDLSFTVVDGRSLAATALRGRPLLIMFWASTCAPCIAEMPELSALYKELHPRGLELIALAMPYDPPNRVMAAREVLQLPFPVAIDINATVVRKLGVPPQTPQFLLVDAGGHIVTVHNGVWPIDELKAALLPLLADT